MPLEERVAALEKDFATRYREISENETILLGLATKAQEKLNRVQEDIDAIRSDVALFKAEVNRRFDTMEQRFEQRFTSVEGKLEQVLQLLTNRP